MLFSQKLTYTRKSLMKPNSPIYIIIATIAIFIFGILQFFFLYNSFKIKNGEFDRINRNNISTAYNNLITNDLLYVGGRKIIYTYYTDDLLKELGKKNKNQIDKKLLHTINGKIVRDLRQDCDLKTALDSIRKTLNISYPYKYILLLNQISILNKQKEYIPLLDSSEQNSVIAGNLTNYNNNNIITSYDVSSGAINSLKVKFTLYSEDLNKSSRILWSMMPSFILVSACIVFLLVVFISTFRNWQLQKNAYEQNENFVKSIMHEFNTPLTAINVANKMIETQNAENTKLLPLTEIIERQSNRLHRLFVDMRNLSMINEEDMELKLYNLQQFISVFINDYFTSNPSAKDILELKMPAKRIEITFDAFWITLLLKNLIQNALKYNDKKEAKILLKVINGKKNYKIRIADNGIGIDKENRKKNIQ